MAQEKTPLTPHGGFEGRTGDATVAVLKELQKPQAEFS